MANLLSPHWQNIASQPTTTMDASLTQPVHNPVYNKPKTIQLNVPPALAHYPHVVSGTDALFVLPIARVWNV